MRLRIAKAPLRRALGWTRRLLFAAAGGLIGRIEIARLGFSAIVVEGTSAKTLRRAIGHIDGTALPGQSGNIGLSGHRDTFFRPLRNTRLNDKITVTTLLGQYRYRVLSTTVVRPSDIAVLEPTGNEILTLVTCYPFYFVGPAPSRFVVRAESHVNSCTAPRTRYSGIMTKERCCSARESSELRQTLSRPAAERPVPANAAKHRTTSTSETREL
jgi:sortase A